MLWEGIHTYVRIGFSSNYMKGLLRVLSNPLLCHTTVYNTNVRPSGSFLYYIY